MNPMIQTNKLTMDNLDRLVHLSAEDHHYRTLILKLHLPSGQISPIGNLTTFMRQPCLKFMLGETL